MGFGKPSFSSMLKRRFNYGGLETDGKPLDLSERQKNQKIMDDFFDLVQNKPFWNWGQKHHETFRICPKCEERYYEKPTMQVINGQYHLLNEFAEECKTCKVKLVWNPELILTKAECCFNHIVGLPIRERKDYDAPEGVNRRYADVLPIFDWQRYLFEIFESPDDWLIIAATGLGKSEFKLRHTGWKASTDQSWNKAQIPVIVGQREELSIILIRRLKDLFPFQFVDPISGRPQNMKTATINGCEVKTYPSNHIEGVRSLEHPFEIIVDEFDFFHTGEARVILGTLFRYVAKSGHVLRAITTPNKPLGMAHELEDNPMRFKILKLLWTVGLFTIYTQREIDEQKEAPAFDQEYGLQYLGGIGNFFNVASVDSCVVQNYNPNQPIREAITICGIDTGYSTGSQFGIVIWSWFKFLLWCMYARGFTRPKSTDMIQLLKSLRHQYYVDKFLVDGSDPSFIYDFKESLQEWPVDYHNVDQENYRFMKVEPVPFTKMQYEFLVHDRSMLDKRAVRIHSTQTNLQIAFKSAWVEIDKFIKDKSSNTDLLDASSMIFKRFKPKTINVCTRV
jgi:hypothetical protein